jgi:ABC-type lipoprotein release transport system permease subunit
MSPLAFALRGLARQPGRALLGIAGIAATGALLFDMLMLSQGLVLSMERLLSAVGFDIRVTATQAAPLAGPPIRDVAETVAHLSALPGVSEAVPLRIAQARVDINGRAPEVTLMGADAGRQRPWTLLEGQNPASTLGPHQTGAGADETALPVLLVNRNLAKRLSLRPGSTITLRGECTENSNVPPATFHVSGIAEFPFDQATQLTAITTLQHLAQACGDTLEDEADMLMIASGEEHDAAAVVEAIRRVRPDLTAVTNDELVARFQQVEFSYFRQISFVLATITMFFGLLLITVLLSVSTNQRLGEIAALRALGFSRTRMVSDVLWRSALLVGTGGLVALPLGLALSTWLDRLLQTMPGIPANLRFFVFAPRALILYVALLVITMAVAAIYPMRTVARLRISSTLRSEVIG